MSHSNHEGRLQSHAHVMGSTLGLLSFSLPVCQIG